MEQNNETQPELFPAQKKKKSPVFPIMIALVVLVGGFYGYRLYQFSQTHEVTDDAQITSNMSPVISKISGYAAEVHVKDNQCVKKGDTLIVLENREQKMALEAAKAGVGTARSNIATAKASTHAASPNIHSTHAAIATANAQIEAAKVKVWKTSQDVK